MGLINMAARGRTEVEHLVEDSRRKARAAYSRAMQICATALIEDNPSFQNDALTLEACAQDIRAHQKLVRRVTEAIAQIEPGAEEGAP